MKDVTYENSMMFPIRNTLIVKIKPHIKMNIFINNNTVFSGKGTTIIPIYWI